MHLIFSQKYILFGIVTFFALSLIIIHIKKNYSISFMLFYDSDMQIQFIRHCETEWNRLEKCQGVSDIRVECQWY